MPSLVISSDDLYQYNLVHLVIASFFIAIVVIFAFFLFHVICREGDFGKLPWWNTTLLLAYGILHCLAHILNLFINAVVDHDFLEEHSLERIARMSPSPALTQSSSI